MNYSFTHCHTGCCTSMKLMQKHQMHRNMHERWRLAHESPWCSFQILPTCHNQLIYNTACSTNHILIHRAHTVAKGKCQGQEPVRASLFSLFFRIPGLSWNVCLWLQCALKHTYLNMILPQRKKNVKNIWNWEDKNCHCNSMSIFNSTLHSMIACSISCCCNV